MLKRTAVLTSGGSLEAGRSANEPCIFMEMDLFRLDSLALRSGCP